MLTADESNKHVECKWTSKEDRVIVESDTGGGAVKAEVTIPILLGRQVTNGLKSSTYSD
jgi:hypothetical protein